jgi:hypothetical protein
VAWLGKKIEKKTAREANLPLKKISRKTLEERYTESQQVDVTKSETFPNGNEIKAIINRKIAR